MAAFNLDVGANTRRAERDIQKLVNKSYNINLKTKGDQPLGRITGQVNEFTKSLDASNARVIAFGASAGIIYGVQRAFEAMARSVIDTQKSLQDINVILNVSSSQLQKFGANLFGIARDTGQSFDAVAKAATEFSRQGLGVEETLKRTSNALILSRLSGLDAAKSVEALTAAVNSFANQAVTTTEIVNKFANVDAAFAVSSADLADAISRVGSSAAQSGVSLNELIAIVTSAQQSTARGGAVIGNSFKTIFTRLQRTQVIDLLENLGISTTDSAGQIKSTISLLTDLAKVYDQLGTLQQSAVAEKVGGVFQINILKAALADLGKEYSVYNNALQVAASSTDQAIQRNQELNKTYAAQLNALQENAKQLGANAGSRLLGPAFERVVGGANKILGGINESDGQDAGAVLAKGILDGLGQVIAGPGLALIGGIFLKLFKDLSKFATGSLKDLLGLNTASKQQADLQKSISQILAKQPQLLDLALKGEQGLSAAANSLLTNLQKQTVELQKQEQIAASIAKSFYSSGVRVTGGIPMTSTPKTGKAGKASGYIPNFANGVSQKDAIAETMTAIYSGGYMPGPVSKVDGKVYNKAESVVKFAGAKENAIIPPKDSDAGKQYQKDFKNTAGFDPYTAMAARGFVPNFAGGAKQNADFLNLDKTQFIAKYSKSEYEGRMAAKKEGIPYSEYERRSKLQKSEKQKEKQLSKELSRRGVLKSSVNEFAVIVASGPKSGKENLTNFLPTSKALKTYTDRGFDRNKMSFLQGDFGIYGLEDRVDEPEKSKFEDIVRQNVDIAGRDITTYVANAFGKKGKIGQQGLGKKHQDQISALAGFLFEDVASAFLTGPEFDQYTNTPANARFDFASSPQTLKDLFNIKGNPKIEAKLNAGPNLMSSPSNSSSMANKIYSVLGSTQPSALKKNKASGFIPNFAALGNAINREHKAGVPKSKIYVAQDRKLAASGYNPLGLGVFNTRDEPTAGARSRAIKSRGYAGGYIPNFAEDGKPAGVGETVTAIISELGILAFTLKDFRTDLSTTNSELADVFSNQIKTDKERLAQVKAGTTEYDKLNKSIKKNQTAFEKASNNKASFESVTSALASSITFAAPIIAQTLKNAIGSETKGARATGAAVEGIGGALSAGSVVAQLAPKGKGGKYGAIATGLVAAFNLATGAAKEFGTDLPEISRAAKEASEKLSAFGNISQTVQTQFEQIQDLAGKGQSQEAGKLQQSLLTDTISQINDPATKGKVITAIYNKDAEALRKALEENTKILTEKNKIEAQKEAVETGIQNIRNLQPGFMGRMGAIFKSSENIQKDREKRQQKEKEAAQPIFNPAFENAAVDKKTGNIQTPQKQLEIFKSFRSRAEQSAEEYGKVLRDLGFSEEQVKKLVDDEAQTRPLFLALLKDQIGLQEDVLNNTGQGNKVIEAISKSLVNIRSNYSKYSKAITEGTKNLITSNAEIQNALGRIKANADSNASEISQSFFGDNAVFAQDYQQKSTTAGLSKINSDYETGIRNPIAESLSSVVDLVAKSADKKFGEAATLGSKSEGMSAQQVAEKNFNELPNVIAQISKDFQLPNLESLLQIPKNLENFKGFDIEKITAELTKKFPDSSEEITKVADQLNNANRTLQEQKRIQTEQKILLAQNKLSEITKAFVGAVKESFGGFEGFLSGNTELLDKFSDSAANLKILKQPGKSDASQVEFGRNLGSVITELSKIAGRPIGPELRGQENSKVLTNVRNAQATEIKKSLDNIFGDLSNFEGSKDIAEAFRATLGKQLGLGKDATNEQIARGTAEAQTNAAMATGDINKSILEGAKAQFKQSNPELAAALENVKSAFLDPQSASLIELQRSNDFLQQIAINTSIGGDKDQEARRKSDIQAARAAAIESQKQSQTIPSASRGYLPRFAAGSPMIANDAEFLARNAKKEMQDMSKLGYSGNPILLSSAGFNPQKDAILNPMQKEAFDEIGMLSNAKPITGELIAAKGYMPNFAEGSIPGATKASPELLRKFLEVVNDPKELEKFLAPFEKDFQMLGRAGFSSSLENYNKSNPVDISPYGGKRGSAFSKFSWKELEELGLFSASVETNRMGKEQVWFRNKEDYKKAFEEITGVARKFEVDELAKIAAAKTTKAAGATPNGAKTNVTKAVEEAGKQIPKAAAKVPPVIAPKPNPSSATTFSKAGLVSGTDDAAIAAARAGIGTKVAETGTGVVAKTAENTVEKAVTESAGKGMGKKLGGGLLKYGSTLYAGASALSAIGRKRMEDPNAGAGDLIMAGLKGATIGDQESLGITDLLTSPLAGFGYDFAGRMAYNSLKGKGSNASTTATESLTGSVESAAKKISPRAFFNDLVEKSGGPTAKISSFSKTVIDSLKSGGSMADVKMEDLKRLAPDQLKDLLESGLLDPKKFDLSKIGQFGGNLVKGVGLGIVTDIAGHYAKDKIFEYSGLDKNSYIGGVIDELSESAIAAGSGAVGGGGWIGAIMGLGIETLGKVGRLGSASIDLMRQSNINEVNDKRQQLLDKEAQKAGYANQLEQLQAKVAKVTSEKAARKNKQKQSPAVGKLGTTKATPKDVDDLQKQMGIGKYAPKSKTSEIKPPELKAPVPISDNGIVKRYKTAADAELASRLAKQKNKQIAPFTSATTPTQTAKFPDQIIKKETTPSQDDLRKSMPPEYFRRIAKRNVMELEEGYNQLINKTKDPAKAMALRKKLTEIQSLYNQKIDSREVDMDAFNQIEEIYKSTKKVQTNFEDYHKTPEYRNQVRMRNFAKGSLPMASKLAIAKEGMGGVAPFDMTAVQRPEVQGINNINGMALMERNEINKERLALGARGVIPHFAGSLKPNKTSNEFKFGDMNFNTDGSLTQEEAKKLQESIMQHVQDYMSNNSQPKQKSSNDEFLQALRKDSKFSQYNPPPRPKK